MRMATLAGRSDLLLTLARRHILAPGPPIEEAQIPVRILGRGDFIQQVYPLRGEYLSLSPGEGSSQAPHRTLCLGPPTGTSFHRPDGRDRTTSWQNLRVCGIGETDGTVKGYLRATEIA